MLSCIWERRKFTSVLRLHSGSHAYGVGCYLYICTQGFLRPPNKTWRCSPRFCIYKPLHLTVEQNDMTMFIAILKYKKPLSEVDRFLVAHREYLTTHYAAGDFIASGPQTPRVGGVIMMKADSREAVHAIIAEDPFYINGIADYQIVEFTPTMFSDPILSDILYNSSR